MAVIIGCPNFFNCLCAMYIREKKTPLSKKTAVQLVESVRYKEKVKQKIVRHFGYAFNEEELKAPRQGGICSRCSHSQWRKYRDAPGTRPIFHRTPRRIKAHIALCFMALVCVRTLEYRVNMQYKKMSPEAIRKSITDLEASVLLDTTTGKRYGLPSQATQDAKKIYQILGHKWRDKPHMIK